MKLHPAQPVADINGLSSARVEETKVQVVDFSGGVKEQQTVVSAAFASAGQGDYFVLSDTAGETWAFWLDKDDNGTAPTGAAYLASDNQVEVDIVTGDTAAQVAAKVQAAIESTSAFSTSINSATVTVTQLLTGDAAAPARHNTGDTGNGSFTVATTVAGVIPDLNNKYFTFDKSGTSYYAWFNVNGNGVDPAPGGTGVEVACTGEESASELAALAAAEINALAGITSVSDGALLKIVVDAAGDIANATAGDSGLSVDIQSQGASGLLPPSGNEGATSPTTTIISALT